MEQERSNKTEKVTSLINTICAVLVTGLTIYAFFFTDIPEELARQYSSDIANMNEQLIALQKEKGRLLEEVDLTKSTINEFEEEKHTLLKEINSLNSEQKKLQENSQLLSRNISFYSEKMRDMVVTSYVLDVKSTLNKYLVDVDWTYAYKEIEENREKSIQIDTEIDELKNSPDRNSVDNILKIKDLVEKQIKLMPSLIARELLISRSRGEKGGGTKEILSKIRSEITIKDFPPTAYSVMLKKLETNVFGLLLESDKKALQNSIKGFIKENADILSNPLVVRLSPNFTLDEIPQSAQKAKAAHNDAQRILQLLHNEFISHPSSDISNYLKTPEVDFWSQPIPEKFE